MLTIIACWIFLFFIVFLIGKLFLGNRFLSFFRLKEKFEWYEYFWTGLFVVFMILQVWSIFLPVNYYSLIFMTALALVSLIIYFFHTGFRIPKKVDYKFIFICVIGLLIISYYSTPQTGMADTFGYHLNAVKWTNLYAVVPGLANLHSRLGFNTSFFPFAAMLNTWFMKDRVSHLALSFLVAILFVEFVWIFLKSKNTSLKLFCLFISPMIIRGVVDGGILSSLYYDYALLVLILVACVEFIKNGPNSLIVAAFIAILSFTVKLSGASFALLMLLFITFRFYTMKKNIRSRYLSIPFITGLIALVPYFVKNAILSGWLLYPLPLFRMNFDWTVPENHVKGLYTVIQTWARVPGAGYSNYINASFGKWFPVWFSRSSGTLEIKLFFFSLALIFISILMLRKKKFKIAFSLNLIYLDLISLLSILYILFTAPDFRFGGVFMWTFFSISATIFLSLLVWNKTLKVLVALLMLLFTLFIIWPIRIVDQPYLRSVRWDPASPTKNVNGILMPTGDSCGNSDLPCTPESNNIRWRVPGDLSKGFAPVN